MEETKGKGSTAQREAAKHRKEQARIEAEKHKKFDRNLRIIAGVVTVLGAAATTLMKVMEVEQSYRTTKSKKSVKGRNTPKKLKAPPKAKRGRIKPHWRALEDLKGLHQLQEKADACLKLARSLKGGRHG